MVLDVLALILVVLNFTSVEINLIVASVEMPVSIMMAIMFLIGSAAAKQMGMRHTDG